MVYAASLDDSSWYQSTMDIYTSHAHPWDFLNSELAQFPEMLPPVIIEIRIVRQWSMQVASVALPTLSHRSLKAEDC